MPQDIRAIKENEGVVMPRYRRRRADEPEREAELTPEGRPVREPEHEEVDLEDEAEPAEEEENEDEGEEISSSVGDRETTDRRRNEGERAEVAPRYNPSLTNTDLSTATTAYQSVLRLMVNRYEDERLRGRHLSRKQIMEVLQPFVNHTSQTDETVNGRPRWKVNADWAISKLYLRGYLKRENHGYVLNEAQEANAMGILNGEMASSTAQPTEAEGRVATAPRSTETRANDRNTETALRIARERNARATARESNSELEAIQNSTAATPSSPTQVDMSPSEILSGSRIVITQPEGRNGYSIDRLTADEVVAEATPENRDGYNSFLRTLTDRALENALASATQEGERINTTYAWPDISRAEARRFNQLLVAVERINRELARRRSSAQPSQARERSSRMGYAELMALSPERLRSTARTAAHEYHVSGFRSLLGDTNDGLIREHISQRLSPSRRRGIVRAVENLWHEIDAHHGQPMAETTPQSRSSTPPSIPLPPEAPRPPLELGEVEVEWQGNKVKLPKNYKVKDVIPDDLEAGEILYLPTKERVLKFLGVKENPIPGHALVINGGYAKAKDLITGQDGWVSYLTLKGGIPLEEEEP